MTMTPPPWPAQPHRRSAVVLAGLAALLSAAALTVSIVSRPRSSDAAEPSYSTAQRADANRRLCNSYRLAAHAEHIETNTPNNAALGRLSATNGALILVTAAMDPALDTAYRDAARALANSYQSLVAIATGRDSGDPELESVVNETNANANAMLALCGQQ
ncbi:MULTISPECIES: hypothetical protein [Mycolicibacter]|uniref:Alanine and proline rich membrane protein n=2 Tax=Mycolicibacter TaxID=1073531 RepID=A0ABU5XP00_9MYCO|nr:MULTISPECIES: hypothetical protein [unclassified Mycolicibacter]MEB3023027.1 hypothetical protein [Mycolicibacter sp. MYC098]MEB3033537.1 hypothetical protein [Mycolicibacter sp. MYC340]